MTDYRDPNYRDPISPAGLDPRYSRLDATGSSTAMWGWVAGLMIVVLVLIFAFGTNKDTTQTASNMSNSDFTRQSTPPAPPTDNRPATPAPTPLVPPPTSR